MLLIADSLHNVFMLNCYSSSCRKMSLKKKSVTMENCKSPIRVTRSTTNDILQRMQQLVQNPPWQKKLCGIINVYHIKFIV